MTEHDPYLGEMQQRHIQETSVKDIYEKHPRGFLLFCSEGDFNQILADFTLHTDVYWLLLLSLTYDTSHMDVFALCYSLPYAPPYSRNIGFAPGTGNLHQD